MIKCILCGGQLGWHSDFNLDEVYPEEAEFDDGVVGMYGCGHCEVEYEITTYDRAEHMKIIMYAREEE